jgi:hypothetical protein
MPPCREWYFVRFDPSAIALHANPPNGATWEAAIPFLIEGLLKSVIYWRRHWIARKNGLEAREALAMA